MRNNFKQLNRNGQKHLLIMLSYQKPSGLIKNLLIDRQQNEFCWTYVLYPCNVIKLYDTRDIHTEHNNGSRLLQLYPSRLKKDGDTVGIQKDHSRVPIFFRSASREPRKAPQRAALPHSTDTTSMTEHRKQKKATAKDRDRDLYSERVGKGPPHTDSWKGQFLQVLIVGGLYTSR
ncbi:hypothetical protein ABEB36_012623 [Hypothenemus hampei]|uniref:Uncharacterized protein n=1 Tax=Hypothenemus hampei TaxID=57062 RepID=A0ABD1EBZ2_HYPHA